MMSSFRRLRSLRWTSGLPAPSLLKMSRGNPLGQRPIIDLDGTDSQGKPLFYVDVALPGPARFDGRASAAQMQSIADFYGQQFPEVTEAQAHALLCYRSYGRLVADRAAPRSRWAIRNLIAHFIAAIVAADPAIAADVIAWSDRAFRAGSDSSAIGRTKRYREVVDELASHMAYLEGAGVNVMAL